MLAVLTVWSTVLNPAHKEIVLGNFRTTATVMKPDLRRAMARLKGAMNLELLDTSFHGGGCYVTLHAAAGQKFIRSVRRGVLDVETDVAEADKVTVQGNFGESSHTAHSTQEHKTCSTSEELLTVAGRKRLRLLDSLAKRMMPRHILKHAKEA